MKRILLTTALLFPLAVTTAQAAPTVEVAGGYTTVDLDTGFVDTLTALGVTPAPSGLGFLDGTRARFLIPAGAVDLADASGDIFHTGGLTLTAGETTVELLNFIIDNAGHSPALTGIAAVNGDLAGRLPLFDLALNNSPALDADTLNIDEVGVTLTQEAADALNSAFGISDFQGGIVVGVARVKTFIVDVRAD